MDFPMNKVQNKVLKSAVYEVIAKKGTKAARWLSNDLAAEAFAIAHKYAPKEEVFKITGFNVKSGKPEANSEQKDALLDVWNELRYEEKKSLEDDETGKEPRMNNYSQISGFILRSVEGEVIAGTRSGREEKTGDLAVMNYVRFYGKSKDSFKEFRRALKFTIMSQMARDYNGTTKFGEKMKKEYLDAISHAEEFFKDKSARQMFELTLLPEPLRETTQMKAAGMDAFSVRRKNEEALKKFDTEGAGDQEEQEAEEEESEEEEESFSVEDLQEQIENLKEESKDATKKRKDEIKLEIKQIEEEIANFQAL